VFQRRKTKVDRRADTEELEGKTRKVSSLVITSTSSTNDNELLDRQSLAGGNNGI
jgi:hypothetical protein